MNWQEVKKALKDGATVEQLAEKEGVPYKTMYNRIVQHEKKDGTVYMLNSQLRATDGRSRKVDTVPDVAQLQQPNPKYSADYVAPVPEVIRKLPEVSAVVMGEIKSKIVAYNQQIARLQKQLEDWTAIFEALGGDPGGN